MSETTPKLAKVLTISDGVMAGTRSDRSGAALIELLGANGFEIAEHAVTADGVEAVAEALVRLSDGFCGLIVTTGGTGFTARDLTPEATKSVLEREAPGFAEYMRSVNPLGMLSRGVAGIRGKSLILNTPGSPGGAREMLAAVIAHVPHAIALLGDPASVHPSPQES